MARINIEDDFWSECSAVVAAMGDADRAVGNVVRFFRFAQSKHRSGKLITEEEFAAHGFSEAIIGLFAKRTPSGIQALGSEKHFGWLEQKKEAGKSGGRASATRLRDEKGRLLSKRTPSEAKQSQTKTDDVQPSYSYSYSNKEKEKGFGAQSTAFDFEKLYERYPRKRGKFEGLETCRKTIKTEAEFEALETAIRHYAAEYQRVLKPGEFRPEPQHFSTFMHKERWRDWVLSPEKQQVGNAMFGGI